jgi:hypothetical protein
MVKVVSETRNLTQTDGGIYTCEIETELDTPLTLSHTLQILGNDTPITPSHTLQILGNDTPLTLSYTFQILGNETPITLSHNLQILLLIMIPLLPSHILFRY